MRATAGAHAWAGLAVLSLPCLLVALDAEVLNLAAPQLSATLRPTGVQLLWIMDSYVFVVAGALIAMGVLGDRIGRRRLLLGGAAFFGVASLLAAFATTPAQLIAARVLMGLSGASLMPSTLALIRVMFADARSRAVALAVWSASFALGGVASPLIGGVLLEHFWWGSVFLIAVPAVLLLLAVGPILLPESRDRASSRFDTLGALLSLSAVLLFVYGVKRVAASGWHPAPLAATALAALLGALFLRRQRRIAHPLLDLSLFRDARISVALGSNALAFFVQYGTQLAIAQYLQLALGLSPLRAGLWMLPSVLAYLGASFLAPALARRTARGRVIAAGLAVMAGGFAVLAYGGLEAVVAGTVLFSIGLAPVYILTTDLVVGTVRPQRAGMAAAVTETGCELGGALGIAVLGSLTVAAYRHGMPAATDNTLSDALSTAATLPPLLAEALLRQAYAAYGAAFTLVSATAAVLAAAAAVLAAAVLRPTPRRALPAPAVPAPAVPAPAVSAPAVSAPAVSAPAVSAPAVSATPARPVSTTPTARPLPVPTPAPAAPAPTLTPTSTPVSAVPAPAPTQVPPAPARHGDLPGRGGAPAQPGNGGGRAASSGRRVPPPTGPGLAEAELRATGAGVDPAAAVSAGPTTDDRPAPTPAHAEPAALISMTCAGEIVEVTPRRAA